MADPAELLASAREALTQLPALLDTLLGSLSLDEWRAWPAPGEWSPLEIVCHLRDEEIDDFGARLRVVLDGGQEFAPIDPERWVEERHYRESKPNEALAAFRARRVASLELLASLDVERLRGDVAHRRIGRLSGLDILAAWVAHDRLHLAQLAGTLTRLWADRWSPLHAEYAGPIPYPPEKGSAPVS